MATVKKAADVSSFTPSSEQMNFKWNLSEKGLDFKTNTLESACGGQFASSPQLKKII